MSAHVACQIRVAVVHLVPLFTAFSPAFSPGQSVTAWNSSGSYIPPPVSNPVSVAAAGMFPKLSVALRADGTLAAWDQDPKPPAGLTDVTGISLGANGGVAWKQDGTAASWGAVGGVPAGAGDIVDGAVGAGHTILLKKDGRVVTSGSVTRYVPFTGFVTYPSVVPSSLPRLTRVAAAGSLSFGITANGSVVQWSHVNSYSMPAIDGVSSIAVRGGMYEEVGAMGVTYTVLGTAFDGSAKSSSGVNLPGSDFVAVAASSATLNPGFNEAMLALRRDGTVASWGTQLVPPAAANFAAIAVGQEHGLAVVGDPAQPPVVFGPSAALVFSPGAAGAARVWYQCRAVNLPQNWSATALPPGLVLDPVGGRVSGMPARSGTFDTVFTATNAAGTGQKTVRFHVDATPAPQVNGGAVTVNQDTPFTWSIGVAGDPSPATSYDAQFPPSGLTVNFNTGIISGTPTVAGVTNITLRATNIAGTATGSLILTVVKAVPVVLGDTITSPLGSHFYHRISASGGPHSTYGASPVPPGLSFNPLTGVLEGIPEQSGVYDITLTATNSAGTGSATLRLTIPGPPVPETNIPVLVVNTLADDLHTPAGTSLSLREALRDIPDGGIIRFAPALLGQTIILTRGQLIPAIRQTTILAPAPGITVSGNNLTRIFGIPAGASVFLDGLTLHQGLAAVSGEGGGAVHNQGILTIINAVFSSNAASPGPAGIDGGIGQNGQRGGNGGNGGAILNHGTLTIYGSRFSGNRTGTGGQGGYPGEPNFPIGINPAPGSGGDGGSGGAIYNDAGASLTITACEFTGNTGGDGGEGAPSRRSGFPIGGDGGKGGSGGAIYSAAAFSCRDCFFSQNATGAGAVPGWATSLSPEGHQPGQGGDGGSGGAIRAGAATIANGTFAHNSTGLAGFPRNTNYANGGAIHLASGTVTHCTLTGNVCSGIYNASGGWSEAHGGALYGPAIVENCIIAANTHQGWFQGAADYFDIDGSPVLAGASLLGVYGTTAGPLNGTAAAPLVPGLLPVAFNGGPTRTMRLAANSPARNAALALASTPVTDQRGYPRLIGPAADLGALEEETAFQYDVVVRNLTSVQGPAGFVLRWGAAAGSYTVWESSTLAAGSWNTIPGVTVTFDSTTGMAAATVPFTSAPRRFFQLSYSPP